MGPACTPHPGAGSSAVPLMSPACGSVNWLNVQVSPPGPFGSMKTRAC